MTARLVSSSILFPKAFSTAETGPRRLQFQTTRTPTSHSIAARAYLDINCAHCHNPGGWDGAARPELDLRFQTPLNQTGLERKERDLERQLETGQMPYLGTTLLHDEGIRLVLEYIESL